MLPTDAKARKETPVFSGPLTYFRRTMAGLARVCWAGNEKHNPGKPLHWAREKSRDHTDCIVRHLFDAHEETTVSPCGATIGISVDEETGIPHALLAAWRACAHAELVLEHIAKVNKVKAEREQPAEKLPYWPPKPPIEVNPAQEPRTTFWDMPTVALVCPSSVPGM